MRVYLCAREAPPVWCPELRVTGSSRRSTNLIANSKARQPKPRKAEAERVLEVAKQPKRVISDQIWKAVVKRLATTVPTAQDYKTVTTRAFKDGDATALELLGYFHATG